MLSGPLPLGSRIAILGGGQLGRMLAMAAARLGFSCTIYSDVADCPAREVADRTIIAPYDDVVALDELAQTCAVLTYEFENVPVAAAQHLAAKMPVCPGPKALEVAQDRLVEKRFFQSLGLPVGDVWEVGNAADLERAAKELAGRGILKTRRLGYDGKGQHRFASGDDCAAAINAIGGQAAVLERWVPFECEISVVTVRARDGECRFYDCPRNVHDGGILRISNVPCGLPDEIIAEAHRIAGTIASALDYVGVLAIELFVLGADATQRLLINEMAPRVHNSGHWTMDACHCDQFENHIRAIAGWPLGPVTRHTDAQMRNLIGHEIDSAIDWAGHAQARLHLYGKHEARPGRKMGHVNIVGDALDFAGEFGYRPTT